MQINSRLKEYEVIIENDFSFLKDLEAMPNTQFVIDKNVYEIWYDKFIEIAENRLFVVEATEQNKVLDTALRICEKITEIPAKRNASLVSVGGGIIQDITGFAANIMYRGINWIYVPTTLLAACDSCIGGKTSLNYKSFKNLLGTFYPPNRIYVSAGFFTTLTDRDFKSGLGEVVKFNIIAGEGGLKNIESNISSLLCREEKIVNRFVESSLSFKKRFIEEDEFDRGERIKLNFAHTFGHAIEVVSGYEIPHGTAVAIGMVMANSISYSRGLLNKGIVQRSEDVLLKVIEIDIDLLKKPLSEYMAAIRKDKKQVGNSLTAVLLSKYGEEGELSIIHDMTEEEIDFAIKYFIDIYEKNNERVTDEN